MTTSTALHLAHAARAAGDDGFCTVTACAVATDLTYHEASGIMREHGRTFGRGAMFETLCEAVRSQGFTVEKIPQLFGPRPFEHGGHKKATPPFNPLLEKGWFEAGIKTPVTLAPALKKYAPNETFLIGYRGHCATARNGLIHDWSGGRRLRILDIMRVKKVVE